MGLSKVVKAAILSLGEICLFMKNYSQDNATDMLIRDKRGIPNYAYVVLQQYDSPRNNKKYYAVVALVTL